MREERGRREERAGEMDPYRASNRALWDEWTHVNAKSAFYDLDGFKAGGIRVRPFEVEEIGEVRGKDLLHLQCHFGVDTLSWARLGARVTGVDFSGAAVALAQSLAHDLGLEATFVQADVLDLPDLLDADFDIVYSSRGVLGWLPDLSRWGQVIAHFLRPGGILYITEIHPVAQAFDDDEGVTELRLRYPYFARPEPLEFPVKGSYADRSADVKQPVEYSWVHSLGEVVTAIAAAGLRIEFLHEFPEAPWPVPFLKQDPDGEWRLPPEQAGEIPLAFSLKATKPLSTDDPVAGSATGES